MRVLTVFLLANVLASTAEAADYWVATNGNDSNSGSASSPWATLQYAANQVDAGDTVTVRAGQYGGFQLYTSGTSTARIVFQAEAGAMPEIVSDAPGRPDGINIEGASFVTIDGFRVTGRTRAGIRAVLCENVHIRNNESEGNGVWGILTGFCDDVVVENNITTNSQVEHGIYISNSGDNPTVRNNLIYGNAGSGIHMNGDGEVGGDGIISRATIEGNIIFDNGRVGGSGINMDGVQDSTIRNNLIYNMHSSGMSLYRINGSGPSTGNRVLNNTVHVASDGRWAMNIQDGSSNNVLRNNILLNDHSFRGAIDICSSCLAGFDSDFNIMKNRVSAGGSFVDLAEWQSGYGQDQTSAVASPQELFVSFAGEDFSIDESSPAFNAGQTLADVQIDLTGAARPQLGATDVGAYELAGGPPPEPELFSNGFE